MKTFETTLFFFLAFPKRVEAEQGQSHDISVLFSDLNGKPCSENGVVASWCDASVAEVDCMVHPGFDVYACRCRNHPSECPNECIVPDESVGAEDQDLVPPVRTSHIIMCHGIPKDEPNYILKTDASRRLPLHHCENNAMVANWCNEATLPDVDCLLLPALDEYVCTCLHRAAACPSECVGGDLPDRKTSHAIRCRGIPEDTPNYILE